MIVIGSNALNYWIDIGRTPEDVDIIATKEEIDNFFTKHKQNIEYFVKKSDCKYKCKLYNNFKYEIEIQGINNSTNLIADKSNIYKMEINNDIYNVPTIDILLSLKKSHINYNINWYKNMDDYHLILKYTNYYDKEIYNTRSSEVYTRIINTNKSNDEFFKQSQDKIKRIYEHDSIHKAVSFYDTPLFEKLKFDSSKAQCSKKLFNKLSFEDKINCVKEEVFVIAIERYILKSENIDNNLLIDAYKKAYEKVSTTLTSGWFKQFAIDNYLILKIPDISYYAKFLKNKEKLVKIV